MRNLPQNTPDKNSAIHKVQVITLYVSARTPAHQRNAAKSAQVIKYRRRPNDGSKGERYYQSGLD